MKRVVTVILLALALTPAPREGRTQSPLEMEKIRYLIGSVENLEGAKFIRNGREYDAKAAADHLRLKLRKAGSRVRSADDFIRLCASRSYLSGEPYRIRFTDGTMVETESYLRNRLAAYEGDKRLRR